MNVMSSSVMDATTTTCRPNKGIYRGTARETLTAEVHTRPVADTAMPRTRDDVRTIDLRTFAAAPTRPPAPAVPSLAEDQAQQQQ